MLTPTKPDLFSAFAETVRAHARTHGYIRELSEPSPGRDDVLAHIVIEARAEITLLRAACPDKCGD